MEVRPGPPRTDGRASPPASSRTSTGSIGPWRSRIELAHDQAMSMAAEIQSERRAINDILIPHDRRPDSVPRHRLPDAGRRARLRRRSAPPTRELSRYRNLLTLSAESSIAENLLGQALQVADPDIIRPAPRTASMRSARSLERARQHIENPGPRDPPREAHQVSARGATTAFRLRENELRLIGLQQEYLARNRRLETELVAAAEGDRRGCARPDFDCGRRFGVGHPARPRSSCSPST